MLWKITTVIGKTELTQRYILNSVRIDHADEIGEVLKSIDLDGNEMVSFDEFKAMMSLFNTNNATELEKAFLKTITDLTIVHMKVEDHVLPLWMQIEKNAKIKGKFTKRVKLQCWFGEKLDGAFVQLLVLGMLQCPA